MGLPRLFFKLSELADKSGWTEYELIQTGAAGKLVLSVWFEDGLLLTPDEDNNFFVNSGLPTGLLQLPVNEALKFSINDTNQVGVLLSLSGERVFPHVMTSEERFAFPTGKEEWRRGYIKNPEYSRKDLCVTLKEAERFKEEHVQGLAEITSRQAVPVAILEPEKIYDEARICFELGYGKNSFTAVRKLMKSAIMGFDYDPGSNGKKFLTLEKINNLKIFKDYQKK